MGNRESGIRFGIVAIYGLVLTGIAYLLAIGLASWRQMSFADAYFIVGMACIVVGMSMSIKGNATGSKSFDGSNPAEMMADMESLRMEREATNYYANFTKHSVLNLSNFSFGLAIAGVLTLVIGNFIA